MKFKLLATAALAACIATPVLAQGKGAETSVVTAPGQASATRTVSVAATVTEVDASKGHVTVKGPKGDLYPLQVGPEVRNLGQVKVGDKVNVRYLENLTLTLMKGGKCKVAVIADVTAVNADKKTVTLKGPKNTMDLSVQDPEQLKLIKVGDQVRGVYTQSLAVAVEPAKE